MFTGIIEELGIIEQITMLDKSMQITIVVKNILNDARLGSSMAINGVCLTITSFNKDSFTVDVMPETFRSTSLSMVKQGSTVNVERAMMVGDRFGGHFLSGHIDGIGQIVEKVNESNAVNYTIRLKEELLKYCIFKGSIAIDGTSLTIFGVNSDSIKLALIPHTMKNSVLGQKIVGDIVNIECDMFGKYIYERFSEYAKPKI